MRDETYTAEELPVQHDGRFGLLVLGMALLTFAWGFGLGVALGVVAGQ